VVRLFWSDAWLLTAIECAEARGGADLKSVIGAADALNHAMFTWEELDCGLERLARAGLIQLAGPPFVLTEEAGTLLAGIRGAGYDRIVLVMKRWGLGTESSGGLRAHDP
jgi:hypothetical protein